MIFNLGRKSIRCHEDDATTLSVDKVAKPLVAEDDERSVASTVSTASSYSTVSDNSTSKGVRFNLSENKEYHNTQVYSDECAEQWYSALDYKRFRAHTSSLAKEVAKAEARNRAPFSYQRVMVRTYEVCTSAVFEPKGSILTVDERKHMNRWAEIAPSRLGLEKWAIKSIGQDRSVRRNEIVDVVLDMQESFVGQDVADCDVLIQQACERVSRPSRLFARTVADAQAVALDRGSYYKVAEC